MTPRRQDPDRIDRQSLRSGDNPEHPREAHPDAAVQALIDDGWLEASDRPISAVDLSHAVTLVREVDPDTYREEIKRLDDRISRCAGLIGAIQARVEMAQGRSRHGATETPTQAVDRIAELLAEFHLRQEAS